MHWMKTGCPKDCLSNKVSSPSVNVSGCHRMLQNLTEGHQPNHKRRKISWRDVKQYKHIKKNIVKTYIWRKLMTYFSYENRQFWPDWPKWPLTLFCRVSSRTWSEICVREEKQIQPVSTGKKSVDVIDICVFVFFSSVINTRIVCK